MNEQINITEQVNDVTIVVTQTINHVALTSSGSTVEINVDTSPQQVELMIANAGTKGDSAYQIWLNEGNVGTEADFLESLKPFHLTIGKTPPANPDINWLWIDTN